MFIMSLAIADLTVGIVVIPISATAFIMGPGTCSEYHSYYITVGVLMALMTVGLRF